MAIIRTESFINTLKQVNDVNEMESLCERELSYLRHSYNVQNEPNEKGIYEGLKTYKKAISVYRKAIRLEIDMNHTAIQFFNLNQLEAQCAKYQDGHARMRNYKNRMLGNVSLIKNPDQYLELSIELLTARSYIDNILGLAALTGRRVNEIGFASEFDECDYDEMFDVYHQFNDLMDLEALEFVTVYGLSKKQTYLNDKNTNDTGVIPVLADRELIFTAMADLRKKKFFIDLDDFHNKASKELSVKVKKRYADYLGIDCVSHDLRKAYARLCYDFMINPDVKNDDGLVSFTSVCLQQNVPDNYMKFSSNNA